MADHPAVHHTWGLVYRVNQRLHAICDFSCGFPRKKKCLGNGASETSFPLRLRIEVKQSIVIGTCTLGIKTALQPTTLNVMGASCDLCDVFMYIYHGKCRSHSLNAVSRDERVIYHGKSAPCNRIYNIREQK